MEFLAFLKKYLPFSALSALIASVLLALIEGRSLTSNETILSFGTMIIIFTIGDYFFIWRRIQR